MMYRATTRRDRVDSIIEVPVDDAMTLADRLSKIAAEAAKLAVGHGWGRAIAGHNGQRAQQQRRSAGRTGGCQ